jgi:hypothetical protein
MRIIRVETISLQKNIKEYSADKSNFRFLLINI